MVRNLVGALVKVGQGRLTPMELKNILHSRSRSTAPPTAPAEGLYLLSVRY
jgi:tRNA pseudouridine38-40 synthase